MCTKQTSKKYMTRKSPPYSAINCKGKTMDGKDGSYVSSPDKNNIYKWVKTRKHISYSIEWNGGHPYTVHDYGNRVDVYKNNNKLMSFSYKAIFPGANPLKLPGYGISKKGNTVLLLQKNGKYIYIGGGIYEFEIDDVIKNYYSPIGNSNVPYPYAVGTTHTYFLIEKSFVENKWLDLKKDAYSQLYQFKDSRKKVLKLKTLD